MQKSETIGELAKALAAAQGEILGAKKDSENPFFKSKYADLASVRDACRDPFAKNGLAVVQTPRSLITPEVTIIYVETLMAHASGEWISEELSAVPVKDDPQGIGSCITYLRRYALASFAGVAPEDDDGNAASGGGNNSRQPAQRATSARPTPKLEDAEITQIKMSLVSTCKLLNAAGDKPVWGAKRLDEFAVKEYGKKSDDLELEPLRDLLKKLSNKLDLVKAQAAASGGAAATDDAEMEQNRQIKLKSLASVEPKVVLDAIGRLGYKKPLLEMTLDQLIAIEDELVPF